MAVCFTGRQMYIFEEEFVGKVKIKSVKLILE